MRLNDNTTFIGINPPYQLLVIHSSKLIYPREIYQLGEEIYCEALRHIVEAWEGRPDSLQQVGDLSVPEYLTRWLRESVMNLSPILTVDTPTIWAGSSSRTLNESGCL